MTKIFTTLFILASLLTVYPQPEDSIFVIISGDTVHIWNTGAYENCGCLFRMNVMVSNDTVYVTEVDTSSNSANCICYFDLCASVTGLSSGVYFVKVFRYLPLYGPDTLFIGSTSFTYGGSVLAFISKSFQSNCYNIIDVKGNERYQKEFMLKQNYPNPFNPTTTIEYQVPELSFVTIKLFDVLGREVATLVNSERSVGNYKVRVDGSVLISGVYFYAIKVGNFVQTKKMVLIK